MSIWITNTGRKEAAIVRGYFKFMLGLIAAMLIVFLLFHIAKLEQRIVELEEHNTQLIDQYWNMSNELNK